MNKPIEYLASLPERTVRAGAAVAGGLLAETANLVLPSSLRRARLYQATFERLLRVTVELVGDVPDVYPDQTMSPAEMAKRKVVGNAVELAGVLSMGWSPLWLLAAASDLTGGTRAYLAALVDELKTSGVLPEGTDVASVDALLQTLEGTSGVAADAVDLPPIDVAALRTSWAELKANVGALPDAAALAATFEQLRAAAVVEGRSLLDVSAVVAAGALRAGWTLGNTHIFEYYREALAAIQEEGLLRFARRVSTPYLSRALLHFSPREDTYTERWLRQREPEQPAETPEAEKREL
jgi:hypothetical protein